MERLPSVPHAVALTFCSSRGAASAGVGLVGLVTLLIDLGVGDVVVSVVPVSDAQGTSDMMVVLHKL
jgi:hypothetical protein